AQRTPYVDKSMSLRSRIMHHGSASVQSSRWHRKERRRGSYVLCLSAGGGRPLRHLYGARAASAPSVKPRTAGEDRIDRVLIDLIQPSDYVKWEYFSRQRLLATGMVASRRATTPRLLDIRG